MIVSPWILLRMRNVSDKTQNFMFNNFFCPKFVPFMRWCRKIRNSRTGHRRQCNMAPAHYVTTDTLRICNTYWSPPPHTANIFARTPLNVTLYVNRTCCFHQQSSSALRQDHVSPCVKSCCPSAAISARLTAVPRHPCNGFLPKVSFKETKRWMSDVVRSETLSVQILWWPRLCGRAWSWRTTASYTTDKEEDSTSSVFQHSGHNSSLSPQARTSHHTSVYPV
jgi:hypothetical protein